MAKDAFCEEQRIAIERQTDALLADVSRGFADKARNLGHISAFNLSYTPGTIHAYAKRASANRTVVAALVACDVVPCTEALFMGHLDGEDPLTLTRNGVSLAVKSGLLARVYTNNDGHDYMFGPTSRFDDETVPVADTQLRVVNNRLIPAKFHPSPMTKLADETLASIDGLDFKICYVGANVPEVNDGGEVSNRYDRMGLVNLFGEDVYVEIMKQVASTVVA